MKLPKIQIDRINSTLSAIPNDARSGLEIGFYEFVLTKLLSEKLDLISIDLPRPVLDHEAYRLVFSDIQALPFLDRVFDIVVCTEVLEHLSDEILIHGVTELKRVARKYILVSVPYKQRIWNELFQCSNCGASCNNMGHLRFMDEEILKSLFNPWRCLDIQLLGEGPGYAPDWIYQIAYRYGGLSKKLIFLESCPNCGSQQGQMQVNKLGWFFERFIWRLEAMAPKRPLWLMAIFQSPL